MTHHRVTAVATLLVLASLSACRAAPGTGTTASAAKAEPAAAAAPGGAPVNAVATAATVIQDTATFTGAVTETMNSGGYTYMKLHGGKDGKEDIWVAAAEFAVKVGQRVSVVREMAMENFHSTTLNRDFPVIYFVPTVTGEGETMAASGAAAGAAPIDMVGSHQPAAAAAPAAPVAPPAAAAPVEPIPPPAGGLKIADVWAQRKALGGKPVIVRGKVVKVNLGIMDRNWLHLQDGSGNAKDRTNDLTVTTTAEVKLGDIVTMSGVLAAEKDFGSGYAYDAILESAKVTGK
jgi:hypothetical protein